jgi:hypothetical protein
MGGVCTGLESERAGSRTLEKSSRRDRDRVCAKFERSRRFRGSNMNPKKKLCRCRGLGLDSGLDLAISRFIHSLVSLNYLGLSEGHVFKMIRSLMGICEGKQGFLQLIPKIFLSYVLTSDLHMKKTCDAHCTLHIALFTNMTKTVQLM